MKILLLFPGIVLACLSSHLPPVLFHTHQRTTVDSGIINHVFDGSTDEWPDEKFETDKETSIKYAIDNDAEKLFLAMRIPDFRIQMKMMRQGMNLYIDMKGKKKEGRGIEFPVKKDFGDYSGSGGLGGQQTTQPGQQDNGQQRNFDKKAIRSSMALSLIYMKIFGFSDTEPQEQGLLMDGSANISFLWDSSDVMHIEYEIPLKMLDESVSSLNQKSISIGWKINGVETQSSNTTSSFGNSSGGGGRGGGARGGGGGGGFNRGSSGNSGRFTQEDMEKMMRDQDFWTKYTFTFPAQSKGF